MRNNYYSVSWSSLKFKPVSHIFDEYDRENSRSCLDFLSPIAFTGGLVVLMPLHKGINLLYIELEREKPFHDNIVAVENFELKKTALFRSHKTWNSRDLALDKTDAALGNAITSCLNLPIKCWRCLDFICFGIFLWNSSSTCHLSCCTTEQFHVDPNC